MTREIGFSTTPIVIGSLIPNRSAVVKVLEICIQSNWSTAARDWTILLTCHGSNLFSGKRNRKLKNALRAATVHHLKFIAKETDTAMARVDDYQQARDLAAQELAQRQLTDIATCSGWTAIDDNRLHAQFLGREYTIAYPTFEFEDCKDPTAQVQLQEQVLILHYLLGCRPAVTGRWIAYREIPGAGFYFGAFVKRAIDPLKKAFGANVAGLAKASGILGATAMASSGTAFQLTPLPYVPLQWIVWEGDDEFPAEANILFDATIGNYLSPEDVAWLSGMVVYRLMGLAR